MKKRWGCGSQVNGDATHVQSFTNQKSTSTFCCCCCTVKLLAALPHSFCPFIAHSIIRYVLCACSLPSNINSSTYLLYIYIYRRCFYCIQSKNIQNRSLFLTHTSLLLIHLFQDSNNVGTIPFSSLASQTCESCHGIRPSHHNGTTKKLKKPKKRK